ncbi:MAG: D-alanyl-D-alanine carboxypeptidase [Syntrophobacteraceae bacterium]|nr:D-alanyl-D-alanine carboxypeptidase [Syntrophobacteraceae bacterium]
MKRQSILLILTLAVLALPLVMRDGARAAESAPSGRSTVKPARKAPETPHVEKHRGADPARRSHQDAPKSGSPDLSPGQVEARSAVLVDVASGTVLFEQNADERIEPASFTKILTLFLVFDALKQGKVKISDEAWVSETAWRTGGSKMFVGVGTKVPLEELIKGIAVVSGNDACVVVGEYLHGSLDTFMEAMNRKARELGMTQSYFLNPHGLPAEGQITTAREMAILDTAYLQQFPESLKFHSMREYTYNGITQYNRNHLLLKDSTVDGLKTGFVDAGGYHLAATAQREGLRLLAVIMGAERPSIREREALKLLNYGFRNFTMVKPFPEGQPIKTVKVWKGMRDDLSLYPQEVASFTISQAQKQQLRWEVHAPEEITAPIQAGQRLGEVVFFVGEQANRTIPLVSREPVELAGWLKRAWQSVARLDRIDWKWVGIGFGGLAAVTLLIVGISSWRSRSRRTFG